MRRLLVILILVSGLTVSSCGSSGSGNGSASTASTAGGRAELPWFGVGNLTSDTSVLKGTGSGYSSPGGRWTYSVTFTFGALQTQGEGVMTMESGDQLSGRIDTTVIQDGSPLGSARNRFVWTITGGTGAFAGATGSASGEVQEQKVTMPVIESTLWFSGTISH